MDWEWYGNHLQQRGKGDGKVNGQELQL
jgi:hypothetical protein